MLTPEEEAGIEAALASYRQGRVVDAKRAREIIVDALDYDMSKNGGEIFAHRVSASR